MLVRSFFSIAIFNFICAASVAILFASAAFAQSVSREGMVPSPVNIWSPNASTSAAPDTAFPSLSGAAVTPNTPTPTTPQVATESSYSQLNADILKQTLIPKSLRESAYLDGVIALRDKGKITNQSLNSAYNYALKKKQDRRVQYFQNALEIITRRY